VPRATPSATVGRFGFVAGAFDLAEGMEKQRLPKDAAIFEPIGSVTTLAEFGVVLCESHQAGAVGSDFESFLNSKA
jgi:hypothetical protein